jgi:hypothetical protein
MPFNGTVESSAVFSILSWQAGFTVAVGVGVFVGVGVAVSAAYATDTPGLPGEDDDSSAATIMRASPATAGTAQYRDIHFFMLISFST